MNAIARVVASDAMAKLGSRRRIEALVESLIDLLDAMDGDADAEPGTDDDACRAEDELPCNHLLGPGDNTDAEPEADLGAAEDEGVARFPPMRLGRIGCPVFEGI